ncbi:MAG: methyltransferase domain-containing protein [candidate division NC10 bacterium]|nr:methyltransferase domain-containing protein [candidate division NC10 bacterium]
MDATIRKAAAQFGRQAAHYTTSRSHGSGDSLAVMVALAGLAGTERVLDVATGTGFNAFAFAVSARGVVAVDLTAAMLGEARRLAAERAIANVTFVRAVAGALPFGDRAFDVTTCRIAPHHFPSVPAFLAEVVRVTRPGGRVVVGDTISPEDPVLAAWHNRVETLRDPSHVRNYTAAEWQAFAEAAGLTVAAVDNTCRSRLTFGDWVTRGGTDPERVAALREAFAAPPPGAVAAFDLRGEGDALEFAWPITIVAAIRP